MGLLSGLLGHSSKADVGKLQKDFAPLLADGEELVAAYRVLRDMIVFTTKRLILVNKQGVTGSKVEETWIGDEVITATPGWPSLEIETSGRICSFPDIAVLGNF